MTEPDELSMQAIEVRGELVKCRQRGLDALDMQTHNQPSVPAPRLEELARSYCGSRNIERHGRVAQIRQLMHDALPAYAEYGYKDEAVFIGQLFFDAEGAIPGDPGQRLQAVKKLRDLDEDKFGNVQRTIFGGFARFLFAFVASPPMTPPMTEAAPSAETDPVADEPPSPIVQRHPAWLLPTAIGGAALLVVVAVILAWVKFGPIGDVPRDGVATRSAPTPVAGGVKIGPAPIKTALEVGFHRNGTPTFADPFNPVVTGMRIAFQQEVQVSCKVKSASLESVIPDGYWYRLASAPWNNNFYAPANTFLNGDPVAGPYSHATDFTVPDCPLVG